MTFKKNGFASGLAYNSGAVLLGIVSIAGRLSVGLLMLVGEKTILEGGPRTLKAGQWLNEKTSIFFVKSCSFIKPHIIKAGKIMIALLVIALRKINMRTIPQIETTGRFMARECAEFVKKYKAKIRGKINNVTRKKLANEETGEGVSLNNLSLDQTVSRDKESRAKKELDILES